MPCFSCLPRPRNPHVLLHVQTFIMCFACLSMVATNHIYTVLCTLMRRVVLLFPHHPTILLSSSRFLTSLLMSHPHPTSSPLDFQPIFNSALKAYKKRTKNDLLTHPLADRLKASDSASSILTVLREQVQELNEARRNSTKWLDPIVNVLNTFSETLGEGVGSVCFRTRTCPRSTLSYLFDRYSHRQG